MKKIFIYITLGMTIVSMLVGGKLPLSAQVESIFHETIASGEILREFEDGDFLFTLLETGDTKAQSCMLGSCKDAEKKKLLSYLESKSAKGELPSEILFAPGKVDAAGYCKIYALKSTLPAYSPGIRDIESVDIRKSGTTESYDVFLAFNKKGSEDWATMTRKNTGRDVAIVVNGEVLSAPRVQMEISGGKCRISGNQSKSEAENMARYLGH